MSNYFNSLPLRTQLQELGKCRFMGPAEFEAGVAPLAGKKLVIIGCGAQGFNQGLNLRDSGLNVAYALRKEATHGAPECANLELRLNLSRPRYCALD